MGMSGAGVSGLEGQPPPVGVDLGEGHTLRGQWGPDSVAPAGFCLCSGDSSTEGLGQIHART